MHLCLSLQDHRMPPRYVIQETFRVLHDTLMHIHEISHSRLFKLRSVIESLRKLVPRNDSLEDVNEYEDHIQTNKPYRPLAVVECATPIVRNITLRSVVMIMYSISHPKCFNTDHYRILREVQDLSDETQLLFCETGSFSVSDEERDFSDYMTSLFFDLGCCIFTSSIYYNNVCFKTQPLTSKLAVDDLLRESPEDCPVCLNEFPQHCPDFAILPGCGHKFCGICIQKWIFE